MKDFLEIYLLVIFEGCLVEVEHVVLEGGRKVHLGVLVNVHPRSNKIKKPCRCDPSNTCCRCDWTQEGDE